MKDNFAGTFRSVSLKIISNVENGGFLDDTIDRHFSRTNLTSKQKALIYEIVSGVIRWKGYLDWVIDGYAKKRINNDIRNLIRIGIYQIIFMEKSNYHIVRETVEHAKGLKGLPVAHFVNAILRRYLRETGGVIRPSELSVARSFPGWLVKRWQRRYGQDETERLLRTLNNTPRFALRINPALPGADETVRSLEASGISISKGKYLESAFYVDRLAPVINHALFREGLIHIQDESSQLVSVAARPGPGSTVLDACAGFGTKTLHLRDLYPEIKVVAMDTSLNKLKTMQTCGYVLAADALRPPFRDGQFDMILVDPPCSSFGIIRKHPEIKWHRHERDIKTFASGQVNLLQSLWDILKTGGYMIYSVCTFEPEETTGVIETLKREKRFLLEDPLPFLHDKCCFQSLPDESGMDGFFIARLKKL